MAGRGQVGEAATVADLQRLWDEGLASGEAEDVEAFFAALMDELARDAPEHPQGAGPGMATSGGLQPAMPVRLRKMAG